MGGCREVLSYAADCIVYGVFFGITLALPRSSITCFCDVRNVGDQCMDFLEREIAESMARDLIRYGNNDEACLKHASDLFRMLQDPSFGVKMPPKRCTIHLAKQKQKRKR